MELFFFLLMNILTVLSYISLILVLFCLLLSHRSVLFLFSRFWRWASERTQVYQHFIIPKFDGNSRQNPLYRKAVSYLSSLPSLENSDLSSLFASSQRANHFTFQLAPGQKADDFFDGVRITWTRPPEGDERLEIRVRQQDRVRILRPYLRHIEADADTRERRQRNLQLFNAGETETWWVPIPLTHLCDFSGFKMLAMSYLGLSEHPLFEDVEEELRLGAKITLAEASELIIEHRRAAPRAIRTVLNALQQARRNGEGEGEREAARVGRMKRAKRFCRRVLRMERRRDGTGDTDRTQQ